MSVVEIGSCTLDQDPAQNAALAIAGARPGLRQILSVAQELDSLDPEADAIRQAEVEPLESLTIAQLLARQAPPEWLLPGMLKQRQAAVILGPSRCLKSSLAVDLCGALATGGTFLGEFAAERAFRVGFVGGEASRDVVTNLARRWSDAAEVDLAALDRIVWALNMADPSELVNLRRVSDWIHQNELEVVLIDAADLTWGMTPRGEAAQLRRLVRCCLKAGATPIVCARTRNELKPRYLDASDLANAACGAVARQWLLVNRREAFEPGTELHRLWLTQGNDAGQSGLWGVDIREGEVGDASGGKWSVTLRERASVELEAAQLTAKSQAEHCKRKLRAVISQIAPEDATKLKIREQSGMSGAKFGAAWDGLASDGEIGLVPSIHPNHTYAEQCYRLVDPNEKMAQSSPLEAMDDGWLSMTTAELLASCEKKSPPSPVDSDAAEEKTSPASPLGGFQEFTTAELFALYEKERSQPSPLEPAPPLETEPAIVEQEKKLSRSSPVRLTRKERKRRAKSLKRRW